MFRDVCYTKVDFDAKVKSAKNDALLRIDAVSSRSLGEHPPSGIGD